MDPMQVGQLEKADMFGCGYGAILKYTLALVYTTKKGVERCSNEF